MDELLRELQRDLEQMRREVARLSRNQGNLDARLLRLEYSRIFRALRWAGGLAQTCRERAGQLLLRSRLHPIYVRVFRPRPGPDAYQLWLKREQASTADDASHQECTQGFAREPLISIVLPVHDPPRSWLEAAVDSVLAQTYAHWELCVCDDASAGAWVEEYFRSKAGADDRIRFVRSHAHLGIAGALDLAGELAKGEYVGFLDQDDLLSPYALRYVVEAVQDQQPVLVYSDEDQIDPAGRRSAPTFKPAWDPELLTGCMYLGHFLVVLKTALDRVNWFRSEFDGSQDYDLALRLTDSPAPVSHIPRVLYHWRRHQGSTCGNPGAKPRAHSAGRSALADAVRRRGWQAQVEDGESPTTYRLRRELPMPPRASLVICSRNASLLRRFLRAIQKRTDYGQREIVVVQHRDGKTAAMDRLLVKLECTSVPYEGEFNFSRMNNRGAQAAQGEVLVFLNDDIEPLAPGWLAALMAQAQRPEVGVVGARLLYPSGAVQHSGIVIGIMDGAGHPQRGCFQTAYWNWGGTTRNVSAVTGACLAIRKRLFEELGGFDPAFPVNYNDLDLCLRARKAGYAVLCEPAASLRHYEARTRLALTRYEERELLYQRWWNELDRGDPFYSPNLTRIREDASLRLEDWPPCSGDWRARAAGTGFKASEGPECP